MEPTGWYPDPSGQHQLRWWTGSEWSGHVSNPDRVWVDPPPAPPAKTRVGPVLAGLGIAAAIGFVLVLIAYSLGNAAGTESDSRRSATPNVEEELVAPEAGAGLTISPAPPSELPGPAELSVGQAGTPVVTPDEGQQIVDTIWRLRAEAMNTRNVELLRQIETGPALEGDVQTVECSWCPVQPVEKVTKTSVAVPRQDAYPARIWAQVLLTHQGRRSRDALVVITRASADDTWRVALEMEVEPGSNWPPLAQPDDDGYGIVPAPAQAPEALFTSLAAYWQHWKDHGAPPPDTPFGEGPETTGKGRQLAAHPQDRVQANGLLGHYRYWFDPRDPIYSFGLADKHFACSVVRHITHITSPDPDSGPYQDPERKNWGRELAPGIYPALDEHHVEQTCIVSSPDEPDGVWAIGDNNVVTAEIPADR